jgi:tellurite resistance protein
MQGAKNIILGSICLAAGSGLMVAVDLGDILSYGVWSLIAVGAVMLASGLYQLAGPSSAGVDAHQAYQSSSTARLLMQSMLTTALADGHIDDEEVEAIVDACEEVVHEHLDPDSVRQLAVLIEGKGDAILNEIRYEGKMLNLAAKKAVINACIMVLMADGKTDVREMAAVNAIGEQLGFSPAETEAIVAETMPAGED